MRRFSLPLLLLFMFAPACDGGSAPDGGTPPEDLVPTGDRVAPDVPNLYAGTCFESVVACFDYEFPCVQENLEGAPGFTTRFENGATYTTNFAKGTTQATSADGTECWSATTDPATDDLIFVTPEGEFRERQDTQGRTITCPDGSEESAPGGDPPWTRAVSGTICNTPP